MDGNEDDDVRYQDQDGMKGWVCVGVSISNRDEHEDWLRSNGNLKVAASTSLHCPSVRDKRSFHTTSPVPPAGPPAANSQRQTCAQLLQPGTPRSALHGRDACPAAAARHTAERAAWREKSH